MNVLGASIRRSGVASGRSLVQRRAMSSGPIDIEAETRSMHSWKKISMYATIGVSAFFVLVFMKSHEHHERGNFPYNKYRVKPYPWRNGDKNLFQIGNRS